MKKQIHLFYKTVLFGLGATVPTATHVSGVSGGNVTHGDATINTQGAATTINQFSDKAIINWNDFDIGASESVRFLQGSQSAIALNRVLGTEATEIYGSLLANGRIFILNPNGILFGNTAHVDVGGLLATTFDIDDNDFINGNYDFFQDQGSLLSYVVNEGYLKTGADGFVHLVAPGVENTGLIVANLGDVVLGSGDRYQVEFSNDGLLSYQVSGEVLNAVTGPDGESMDAAVSNSGQIESQSGHVLLTGEAARDIMSSVVNNSGVIEATSLDGLLGGSIALESRGEGIAANTGTLNVSSSNGNAGDITISGEFVGQFGNALANADNGDGGSISLLARDTVALSAGGETQASALGNGDGGTILAIGESALRIDNTASIEARGGATSGDGGFVETSGYEQFEIGSTPDVSAPAGEGGTWLIDPNDIEIVAGSGNTNVSATTPFDSTNDSAQLGVDLVLAGLSSGDVIITTQAGGSASEEGNITLSTALTYTGGSSRTLTLNASNDIVIDAAITATMNALNLALNANSSEGAAASGNGVVDINAAIDTNGGTFTSTGIGFENDATGTITTVGGLVTIDNTGDVVLGGLISSSSGDIKIVEAANIAINSALITIGNVELKTFGNITDGGGRIVANGLYLETKSDSDDADEPNRGGSIGTEMNPLNIETADIVIAEADDGDIHISHTGDTLLVGEFDAQSNGNSLGDDIFNGDDLPIGLELDRDISIVSTGDVILINFVLALGEISIDADSITHGGDLGFMDFFIPGFLGADTVTLVAENSIANASSNPSTLRYLWAETSNLNLTTTDGSAFIFNLSDQHLNLTADIGGTGVIGDFDQGVLGLVTGGSLGLNSVSASAAIFAQVFGDIIDQNGDAMNVDAGDTAVFFVDGDVNFGTASDAIEMQVPGLSGGHGAIFVSDDWDDSSVGGSGLTLVTADDLDGDGLLFGFAPGFSYSGARDGDVYIDHIGNAEFDISAGGGDVSIINDGQLLLDSISAQDVVLNATGAILDHEDDDSDLTPGIDVTAASLNATGLAFSEDSVHVIETAISGSALNITATGVNDDVYITNSTALTDLTVSVNDGDVAIDHGAESFGYDATTDAFSMSTILNALTFENSGDGIDLNGIDLTGGTLSITTAGNITQNVSENPLIADSVTLNTTGDIGTDSQRVLIQTAALDVNATEGSLYVQNDRDATLSATVTGASNELDVLIEGDIALDSVDSAGSVRLLSDGGITDNNGDTVNVSAGSEIILVGNTDIGASDNAIETAVDGDLAAETFGGSIYLDNTGNLSDTSLVAAGSNIDFKNTGTIALDIAGAGTGTVEIEATGAITDNNADTTNIFAVDATLLSDSGGIGSSSNTIETQVTNSLVLQNTIGGDIHVVNSAPSSSISVEIDTDAGDTFFTNNGALLIYDTELGDGSLTVVNTGNVNIDDIEATGDVSITVMSGNLYDEQDDDGSPRLEIESEGIVTLNVSGSVGESGQRVEIEAFGALNITTTDGDVYLNHTYERTRTITTINAGGAESGVDIRGQGSIVLGAITAGDYIDLSIDSITDGNGDATNLTATTLDVSVNDGVFGTSADVIETAISEFIDISVRGDTGGLYLNNTGGMLTELNLATDGGDLVLTHMGDVEINEIEGGGDVTLTVTGSIVDEHDDDLDDSPESNIVVSDSLTINASSFVGEDNDSLEIDVAEYLTITTTDGSIYIAETDGGNLMVANIAAGGVGNDVEISILGELNLGTLSADDRVTIDAEDGIDDLNGDSVNITASHVTISTDNEDNEIGRDDDEIESAINGVLNINGVSKNAYWENTGALTELNIDLAGSDVEFTNTGNVAVGKIVAQDMQLDVTGHVTDFNDDDTEADLTAHLDFDVGEMSITATSFGADSDHRLEVDIEEEELLVETTNGSIYINNPGSSLTSVDVTAAGTGSDVDIVVNGDVSILESITADDTVTLVATGSVVDSDGSDHVLITATRININAADSIGALSDFIEVEATELNLTTDTDGIYVAEESGDLESITITVDDQEAIVHFVDGTLTFDSSNSELMLTAPIDSLTFENTSGDLALNGIDMTGGEVSLTARAITQSGEDALIADEVSLTGAEGVGEVTFDYSTHESVLTETAELTVTVSDGPVSIANTGDVVLTATVGGAALVESSGDVDGFFTLFNDGNVALDLVNVSELMTLAVEGNVTDNNGDATNIMGGSLAAVFAVTGGVGTTDNAIETAISSTLIVSGDVDGLSGATGNVYLENTGDLDGLGITLEDADFHLTNTGDVVVDEIEGTMVELNVDGAITDDDTNDGTITAEELLLTGTSIGEVADVLEIVVADSLIATATDGDIYLNNTGGVALTLGDIKAQNASVDAAEVEGVIAHQNRTVSITTDDDFILTGTVSASDEVILTATGSISDTTEETDIIATTATLSASAIGADGNALETSIGTLIATATTGGLYVEESNDLTTDNISVAGTDVQLTTLVGDITLGGTTGIDGGIVTLNSAEAIIDGNGATVNIDADTVELTASGGIGEGDALELNAVDELTVLETGEDASVALDNSVAFEVVDITVNNGDIVITGGGDTLLFDGVNSTLSLSAPYEALTFENTGGGIVLDSVNMTGGSVELISATSISQLGEGIELTADSAILHAEGDISNFDEDFNFAPEDFIQTDVSELTLSTTDGSAFVHNEQAVTLTATILGESGEEGTLGAGILYFINEGSVALNTVHTETALFLAVDGDITDNNGDVVNVTGSLGGNIFASGSVGRVDDAIEGNMNGGLSLGASGESFDFLGGSDSVEIDTETDIYFENTGDLTSLSIDAEGGGVSFTNAGDVAVGEIVTNTATLQITGAFTDIDDDDVEGEGDLQETNIDVDSLDLTATSIGGSDAFLDIAVTGTVTATATDGDIYLNDSGTGLTLADISAQNAGVDAMEVDGVIANQDRTVSITTAADLILTGTVSASNEVMLDAGGSITESTEGVDVVATTATLSATEIGATDNAVETSVGTLIATTTTGGLYIEESEDLTTGNITVAGTDAALTTLDGDITLGGTTGIDGGIVTLNSAEAIIDGNGATVNIDADTVVLTASGGIGAADALELNAVNELTILETGIDAGVAIDHTGAFEVVDITVNNGDVVVTEGSEALMFDGATGTLSLSAPYDELIFENTGGGIVLENVDMTDGDVELTSAASITQVGEGIALTADSAILAAGDSIGAFTGAGELFADALFTDAASLLLSATDGGIVVSNGRAATVSGSATVGDSDESIAGSIYLYNEGTITLDRVQADIGIVIAAEGDIADNNGDANNVEATQGIYLLATGDIGSSDDSVETNTDLLLYLADELFIPFGLLEGPSESPSSGNIYVENVGDVDLFSSTENGNLSLVNDGDVGISGIVATDVELDVTGAISNSTGVLPFSPDQQIDAQTVTLSANTIGDVDEAITLSVEGTLTATATDGDIYLEHDGGPLTLSDISAQNAAVDAVEVDGVIAHQNRTVSITTDDDLILTGTVSASNEVILDVGGSITESTEGTDIIATTATLSASEIGATDNALETSVGTLNATTTTGGLYVEESNDLTTGNITVAGNDVALTTLDGDITLGGTTGIDGGIVTLNSAEAIIDGNGAIVNIDADTVELTASGGIGADDALELNAVDELTVIETEDDTSVAIDHTGSFEIVDITVDNTDVLVTQGSDSLVFDGETNALSLSAPYDELIFENTDGAILLDGIDMTGGHVSLSAAIGIAQESDGITLVADSATLHTDGFIGVLFLEHSLTIEEFIQTDVAELTLSTVNGNAFAYNHQDVTLSASVLGEAIEGEPFNGGILYFVNEGSVALNALLTDNGVVVSADGDITDNNGDANNLTGALGGNLLASGSIGTVDDAIEGTVENGLALSISGEFFEFLGVNESIEIDPEADIYFENTGDITSLSVEAEAGDVSFTNTGDVAVVTLTGGAATLQVTGAVTDSEDDDVDSEGEFQNVNIDVNSLNLTATSIGESDAFLDVSATGTVTATSTDGDIYLNDSGSGLTLGDVSAQNAGVDAMEVDGVIANQDRTVSITTDDDLILTGTVSASNEVILDAGGSITESTEGVDVVATSATLNGTHIGSADNALETSVGTLISTTTAGGLYIDESDTLTTGNIDVTGGNVELTTTLNDITLRGTTGIVSDGTVSLISENEIVDGNAGTVNIDAATVVLTAPGGIGADDAIELNGTVDLTINESDAAAGIGIDNTGTLTTLDVTTNNGDVSIAQTGGALTFDSASSAFSLTAPVGELIFENTGGSLALDGVDVTGGTVALTVSDSIFQMDGSVLTADAVTLTAVTAIGELGDKDAIDPYEDVVVTDTASLNVSVTAGEAFLRNQSDVTLTAQIDSEFEVGQGFYTFINDGDVALNEVNGYGNLIVDGDITDNNGDAANLTSHLSIGLYATGNVGTPTNAIETVADGNLTISNDPNSLSDIFEEATESVENDIHVENTGDLTQFNVRLSGDNLDFRNTGDVAVGEAEGNDLQLNIEGNVTDSFDDDSGFQFIDFTADSLVVNAHSFGEGSDSKIETRVTDRMSVLTTAGGIYIDNGDAQLESLSISVDGSTAWVENDTESFTFENATGQLASDLTLDSLDFENTDGSIVLNGISNIETNADLTSTGTISQVPGALLTAGEILFFAEEDIGASDLPIRTATAELSLASTTGSAFVENQGDVALGVFVFGEQGFSLVNEGDVGIFTLIAAQTVLDVDGVVIDFLDDTGDIYDPNLGFFTEILTVDADAFGSVENPIDIAGLVDVSITTTDGGAYSVELDSDIVSSELLTVDISVNDSDVSFNFNEKSLSFDSETSQLSLSSPFEEVVFENSGGDITLNNFDMTDGVVELTAMGSINQLNQEHVLTADAITLNAMGDIGMLNTSEESDIDLLKLDTPLLSVSASGGGAFILNKQDVTLDAVVELGEAPSSLAAGVFYFFNEGDIALNTVDTTAVLLAADGDITDNNGDAVNLISDIAVGIWANGNFGSSEDSIETMSSGSMSLSNELEIVESFFENIGEANPGDFYLDNIGSSISVTADLDNNELNLVHQGDLEISEITVNTLNLNVDGHVTTDEAIDPENSITYITAEEAMVNAESFGSDYENRVTTDISGAVNITTTDGGIYLEQVPSGQVLELETANAGGDGSEVNITADGDINAGNVTSDNAVTLTSGGQIVDATVGTGSNISTNSLELTAATGIGASDDALDIDVNELEVTTATGGIYLSNESGSFDALTVSVENSDVLINHGTESFSFDTATSELASSSPLSELNFENTGGDIALNGLSMADGVAELIASGEITQVGDTPFAAASITLSGQSGIGSADNAVLTDTGDLILSTTEGAVFVENAQAVTFSGTATGASGALTLVNEGSVALESVSAIGAVLIDSSGAITDNNGSGINITAGELDLTASTGIGAIEDALDIDVNELQVTTATGGIYLSNESGSFDALTVSVENSDVLINHGTESFSFDTATSELASSSPLSELNFENTGGDIALNGLSMADGVAELIASGEITQVGDTPFAAASITLSGQSGIGSADNAVLTDTGDLILSTTEGAVFVENAQAVTFSGTATGASGALTLVNEGSVALESVSALGAVLIDSSGAITDNNGSGINITAGELDLTASTGIGAIEDALDIDVNELQVTTATGGIYLSNESGSFDALTVSVENSDVLINHGTESFSFDTATSELASSSPLSELNFENTGGDIALNGLSMADGVAQLTASGEITQVGDTPFTAASITLSGQSGIGSADNAVLTDTGDLILSTTEGAVFVENAQAVTFSGTATGASGALTLVNEGSVALESVSAIGAVLIDSSGAITDNNGSGINITAGELDLTASTGIGAIEDALDIDVNELQVTTETGGIYLSNESGSFDALTVSVENSDVLINHGTESFSFDTATSELASSSPLSELNFENTGGDIALNGLSMAGGAAELTASGEITQVGDTPFAAASITLSGLSGIGSADNAVLTDTGDLTLSTTEGAVFVENAQAVTFSGTATGASGALTLVNEGSVALESVSALGAVLIDSSGAITDSNGTSINITASELDLTASTGIGAIDDALDIDVNELQVTTATGGIYLSNESGSFDVLTVSVENSDVLINHGSESFSFDATSSELALSSPLSELNFENTGGDIALNGLSMTGGIAQLTASGSITQVGDTSFAASSITLTGQSGIGSADNAVLTDTADLTLSTVDGAVFVENAQAVTFSGTATGASGALSLVNTGSIALDVVDALGLVSLASDSAITDNNGSDVNVLADNLILVASTGIGASDDSLDVEVDHLRAATATGGIYVSDLSGGLNVGNQGIAPASAAIPVGVSTTDSGDIVLTVVDGNFTNNESVTAVDDVIIQTTETDEADSVDITLSANVSSTSGSIMIASEDSVIQHSEGDLAVSAADETITVHSDDNIAMNAGSSALSNGGTIRYESTSGDITVGVISTDALRSGTGSVELIATNGSIVDDNIDSTSIVADYLQLRSATGVGGVGENDTRAIDTEVNQLDAAVTETGALNINEADDIVIESASTNAGDIHISSRMGNLNVDTITAMAPGNTVTLVASTGRINDNNPTDDVNIEVDRLALVAGSGIGLVTNPLDVNVDNLVASTNEGGIYINDFSSGNLTIGGVTAGLGTPAIMGLSADNGAIDLTTSGVLVIAEAIVTMNVDAININAVDGIQQNADIIGGSAIGLLSGGNIEMAMGTVTSNTTGAIVIESDTVISISSIAGSVTGTTLTVNAPMVLDSGDVQVSVAVMDIFAENDVSDLIASIGDATPIIRVNGRTLGGQTTMSTLLTFESAAIPQFQGSEGGTGNGSIVPGNQVGGTSGEGFLTDPKDSSLDPFEVTEPDLDKKDDSEDN